MQKRLDLRKVQIVLDIIAIILFIAIGIIVNNKDYFLLALWAVLCLKAHVDLYRADVVIHVSGEYIETLEEALEDAVNKLENKLPKKIKS